ncbi:MAG: hypothetical protein ACLUPK_06625 [Veillonella sp.]
MLDSNTLTAVTGQICLSGLMQAFIIGKRMKKKTFGIWNVMVQKRFSKNRHERTLVSTISLTIAMMTVLHKNGYTVWALTLNLVSGDGSKTAAIGKTTDRS